ncbi:MAG TPA: tripartite tricarboxylate transporter substrate binding protein [Burkholderiales bacterium]|nr:tripartite tricarboxylate transporter substrate binding protein [Burkholderiales bacterium]
MRLTAWQIFTSIAAAVTLAGAALVHSAPVLAQAYPGKPLRIIVPWAPGGTADILARILGQKMAEDFGQQVLVDNRPGASGLIGTEALVRSAPDGYTLLLATTAPNSVAASLYPKLPYDVFKDFAPISLLAKTFYVMSVHPSLPVTNVREFVAFAKSRPGQLNFASAGNGTPNHLSGEMFKSLTGVRMQHIPYKGSAPAVAEVIGGQVPLVFENVAVVVPHIKAGRLRALAITSAKRSALLPEVPTIAESGFPGFEAIGWFGVMVPATTPREIVVRLNGEIVRVLGLPDVRRRVEGLGAEVVSTTPEAFDQFNRAQVIKWAKVVKDSGARPD